jgi:hypothetical protein
MPVNAMLADPDIAPRRAATNTDPDIATRHALGGHGAVHVRPRTPNSTSPRPATVRFTSGQLGLPNKDASLPSRTVVQTNKACPEARLFPRHPDTVFRLGRTYERWGVYKSRCWSVGFHA